MEIHDLFLLLFVCLASWTDIRHHKIPNTLIVIGLLCSLFLHIFLSGWSGLQFALGGMVVGSGLLFVLYVCHAIGAGDVKLFAVLGAISGIECIVYISMYALVFAGLFGSLLLLFKKKFMWSCLYYFQFLVHRATNNSFNRQEKPQTCLKFPFMYAVLPATLTAIYLLH